MPLTSAEKLDARQTNAAIMLTANFVNTLAVGLLIGGFVTPEVNGKELGPTAVGIFIGGASLLHITGRLLVSTLRPEE